MKNLITRMLMISGLMLAFNVQAETKIGYIDSGLLMTKSGAYARAEKRLEKEFERRKTELNTMQNKLRDLKTAIDKADVTMPESERRQRERDWNNLSGELQRKGREFSEDLGQRQREELKAIQDKIRQVIRQVAEAGKYDLVIEDAVYFSSSIDLTQDVLKLLNEKADK